MPKPNRCVVFPSIIVPDRLLVAAVSAPVGEALRRYENRLEMFDHPVIRSWAGAKV